MNGLISLKFAQPKGILWWEYFDERGLCEIDESFCLSRREASLAICLQDEIESLMNTRIRSRRPKRQRMLTMALLHGGFERQEGAVVESFTRCVGNELARVFAFC